MKKLLILTMTICLLICSKINCVNAEQITHYAEVNNGLITIGGVIPGATESNRVAILVKSDTRFLYINQTTSTPDGKFEFIFRLPSDVQKGSYSLKIGSDSNAAAFNGTFEYCGVLKTVRQKFMEADINVNINSYTPVISGTVYCTQGKEILLNITNKTDNTVIKNETVTSENGVYNLSCTLPSLVFPKEYDVTAVCRDNGKTLADMSVNIDSEILLVNVAGNATTAKNVEVEAQLQSTNLNLIDKSITFSGAETLSTSIPNIVSNASFHFFAEAYETVEVLEESDTETEENEPVRIKSDTLVYGTFFDNKNIYVIETDSGQNYVLNINDGFSYETFRQDGETLVSENIGTSEGAYIIKINKIGEAENYVFSVTTENNIHTVNNIVINPGFNSAHFAANWIFKYGSLKGLLTNNKIMNTNNDVVLDNIYAAYAVKADKYIFYSNMYDSGKLYRYNEETNVNEKICEDSASWIYEKNGYIYYKNLSDGRSVYKLPLDTEYISSGEKVN